MVFPLLASVTFKLPPDPSVYFRRVNRLRSPNFRSLINENILDKCFRSS